MILQSSQFTALAPPLGKYLLKTTFLLAIVVLQLHAATYYVSITGNDSNAGSSGSPWLSVGQSVLKMACGDTLIVIANGSYVSGDANLPYLPPCGLTTTIQSSALAQFKPTGYRTNPANDSAAYGKLTLTAQGINATTEHHGRGACIIGSLSSDTFTNAFCNSEIANMANGQQVILQIDSQGNNSISAFLTGINILQRYYIVNCSSCGSTGGTFKLAATSGGSPLTISCGAGCIIGAINMVQPLQVNTSTGFITSPDALVGMTTNTPIYFSASGLQLNTLTPTATALPVPLQLETPYYMVNVSGRTFQVSATPSGSPITLTTVGTGPFNMSDARAPNNWAFRGLELRQAAGGQLQLFVFGDGSEAAIAGMVNHVEVDRSWLHEHPSDEGSAAGPTRGIADNTTFANYHDNYISGITKGEAQAIQGTGSPGPTLISNNFLEASGENTLYGGNWPASGVSNANKLFSGNYFYKPPSWKVTNLCYGEVPCVGAASGACWYDETDPHHAGGEWYVSSTAQVYLCNSSGVWATTGASIPAVLYTIKNIAEHKNGRYFTYTGNVFNYSWAAAQQGQVFLFGQEEGSGPGISNDHITVEKNIALHYSTFINAPSHCGPIIQCQTALLPTVHTVQHNIGTSDQNACGVLFSTTPASCKSHTWTFEWDGYGSTYFTWNHNTMVSGDGLSSPWDVAANYSTSGITVMGGQLLDRWVYKNSIVGYDFTGDSTNCTSSVFSIYFTNSTYDRIANPNNICSSYVNIGATNTLTNRAALANFAAVGFTDLANRDYHLTTSSPFSAGCSSGCSFAADDGAGMVTDLGADVDLVNMATSGAIAGTPPWDVKAGLKLTPGSTKFVLSYQAPTTAACTATIYSAPARISGNQVTSVADSAASSITDINTRQIYLSGLTASTHYWYKLVCAGGVIMVGDFWTRAAGSGTYSFTFDFSAATAMRYSSSATMSSPTSLGAATRQSIPVATNSVIYAQVGTTGPITVLIAP